MKTAKMLPAEPSSSSSRRSQPVRQARTNPSKTNSGLNRFGGRDSLSGASAVEQPIDIFPGVTHFADAITALPKELVRHFTLLKEVDAKVFAPEEALFQLIDAALEIPPPRPESARSFNNDASSILTPHSAPMSAQNSSTGFAANGQALPTPSTEGVNHPSVFDPSNLPRRQLFRSTAFKIQEMLVSLEEKNHVISTANDALQKQLARIDDIWPHLESEFSDEAKWGSETHWAYPENRAARALNSQAEKTRREGAAHLAAAAQVIAEEAAARSDARKQAVAAKKNQKNQHHDSEHDDHEGKGKEATTKKTTTKRKPAAASAAAADSPATVGLGITSQSSASHTPAQKRRKVEKPANGAPPPERVLNAVYSNAKDSKAKPSASPRATPAPDGPAPKKRKALPNATGQGKKRAGPGASPSVASSPVIGALPDNSKPPRASPAPSTTARPASARARQNSVASNVDSTKQRPPSAASTKPNGGLLAPIEIPPSNGARGPSDTPKITQMEPPSATTKSDPAKQQSERAPTPSSATTTSARERKGSIKPVVEDNEASKEPTPSAIVVSQPITTTKSGRASKPSTPAVGSFPEGPMSKNGRSRPSRNTEATVIPKRSHKKGASAAHAVAVQKALAQQQQKADEDASSIQDDDVDMEDPNEARYCYCNRVSFGEMVGCDGDDCKIEWFHLECVGLRNAPPKNIKWFCDDCKKQAVLNGKKANGR